MLMQLPQVFVLFFIVLVIYTRIRRSAKLQSFIRAGGVCCEVASQPYVILYLFFGFATVFSNWVSHRSMGEIFRWFSVGEDYLDRPRNHCDALRDHICQESACIGNMCNTNETEACVRRFPEPCDLAEIPGFLRVMVLLSPVAWAICLLISIYHTYLHAQRGRPWQEEEMSIWRERATTIIALPPVYGLFSLRGVACKAALLIGLTSNSTWYHDKECRQSLEDEGRTAVSKACWSGFLEHLDSQYALCFSIADMFEALSLWYFASLCLSYIDARNKRGVFAHSCQFCSKREQPGYGQSSVITNVLMKPLKELTMQGVTFFVVIDFVQAAAYFVVDLLSAPHLLKSDNAQQLKNALESQSTFIEGFVFSTSTIAILNLVTFEKHMHRLLEGFQPKLKFLSAKIIVSLAFIQQIVLAQASNVLPGGGFFLEEQQDLLYASLMCLEMPVIALLTYAAWRPRSIFRATEAGYEDPAVTSDSLVFTLRRGSEDGQQVQVTIQEVSEHDACHSSSDCGSQKQAWWTSASVTLLGPQVESWQDAARKAAEATEL